jgi:hypothetical protein
MRKLCLVALCLIFSSSVTTPYQSCYSSEDDYSSQTFMFTRPLTQNLAMRQSAWHNIIHDRRGVMKAAVQVIAMGQQSMRDPSTAEYFLMKHKTYLNVMGDNALGTDAASQSRTVRERDIRAEWLNLPSNFSGKFSIDPQQSQVGFMIEYNQLLSKWFDFSFFEYMFISLQIPVVFEKNNIHFRQFDIQNAPTTGDRPHDLIEAFNQKEWCYGKISDHKQTRQGVEDLRLMFGSYYLSDGPFQLAYYTHWTFPVTSGDPAHYMFAPTLGSNGHIGMGAGVNVQFVVNRPGSGYDVCFYLDLEHTFMIREDQMRTVDLYQKPWSRYMQFVSTEQGPGITTPGVNVLTRKFTVRPYSMVDGSIGFRITKSNLEFAVGYSIWGRSNEKLDRMVYPFPNTYGIAGVTDPTALVSETASQSTIKQQAGNDNSFTTISSADFDNESGVSRSVINHHANVSVSYLHKGFKVDGTFDIGAFYEIPQYNSGLSAWGVWGKLGTSF